MPAELPHSKGQTPTPGSIGDATPSRVTQGEGNGKPFECWLAARSDTTAIFQQRLQHPSLHVIHGFEGRSICASPKSQAHGRLPPDAPVWLLRVFHSVWRAFSLSSSIRFRSASAFPCSSNFSRSSSALV